MRKKHICIDFEGQQGPDRDTLVHPALLGAVIPSPGRRKKEPDYRCYLFEEKLEPMTRKGAAGLIGTRTVTTLEKAIRELVDHAEKRDYRIAFYGKLEPRQVREFCDDINLIKRFELLARDTHEEARNVVSEQKRRVNKGELSLDRALNRLGSSMQKLPKPDAKGIGNACKRLVNASKQKRWRKWRATQQQLAADLLAYNQQDCLCVGELARRIDQRAARLAASDRSQGNP